MSAATAVEMIAGADGNALAYIVNPDFDPNKTTFLTPNDLSLQMGMIVYGAGENIPAHVHLPITREVQGTNECLLVRKGKCRVTIYDGARRFVAERELRQGAIILLLGGGHGFHCYEDTVLFEVKQGPYAGDGDKERF